MAFTINSIASKSKSTTDAFESVKEVVENFLHTLETKPRKAKSEAVSYGYASANELIATLKTFIITTEPEELFIEEEVMEEDVERRVWQRDEYSIWVDSLTNATKITLFKNSSKVGDLFTNDVYENEDGKWLSISLASIIKSCRGFGLGKQLYKILLKYAAKEYKGLASFLPNRYNTTTVPAIYKKLGGFIDGNWAFIPRSDVMNEEMEIGVEPTANGGYKHVMTPIQKAKAQGNGRPKFSAYWLKGSSIIPVPTLHISMVVENPEKFGYTTEELKQIFDDFNEPYGHEGNARIKIIKDLMNKGWIRVRYTGKNDLWTLETNVLSNKNKDSIWSFFTLMTGHDLGDQPYIDNISRYADVRIHELKPAGTGSYTTNIKDIMSFSGVFENVDSKSKSKLTLIEKYVGEYYGNL